MDRIAQLGLLSLVIALFDAPHPAWAQRVRVRQPGSVETAAGSSGSGNGSFVSQQPSSSPLVPVTPERGAGSPPGFDPYATSNSYPGATPPPPPPNYSPYASTPAPFSTPPPPIQVTPGAPPPYNPAPPFGSVPPPPPGTGMTYGVTPPFGTPAPYGSSTPNSLFPNGVWTPGGTYNPGGPALRFIQNPRMTHTFVYGQEGTDVAINDTEASVTAAFPNFLLSGQPVYISPTFVLHLWDGPQLPDTLADLPSKAYSGLIDAAWKSDPNRVLGADLRANVGAYSDFNTLTTDSLRVTGTGLVTLRLTPTTTVKAGATYLDRLRLKLLPAGGLYWEPNPQTRFDFYFPRPKLSQYLTTVGNSDIWWYVAAEYGGGNWTIEDPDTGVSERVDINDIRGMAGLEWYSHAGLKGFLEGGYVVDREVLYEVSTTDNFRPDDNFMVRGGVSY